MSARSSGTLAEISRLNFWTGREYLSAERGLKRFGVLVGKEQQRLFKRS
jgi:hypothetical protein